jgi:hypothetical protein
MKNYLTKTIEALKGSIKKWDKIVSGKGSDNGVKNCPLCKLHQKSETLDNCELCPVFIATDRILCMDTPYETWSYHFEIAHREIEPPHKIHKNCPDCKKLAQTELDFLKSLLPKGK